MRWFGSLQSAKKARSHKNRTRYRRSADRILDASSAIVIGAYEQRIEKLEREKLVLSEKLETATMPQRSFEEVFELALKFLSSPWNIWKNGGIAHKKTTLRLAFSSPLQYCR